MPNPEFKAELASKLIKIDEERDLVKRQLNRERLTEITSSIIETITSPQVIEKMKAFRESAEKGASYAEAGELMSLESLRAAGAKIPDDFRLTSRVFEDRETGLRVQLVPPVKFPDQSSPVEWGACGGAGAATVCGCAGGST